MKGLNQSFSAILALIIVAGAVYWFYNANNLRSPGPGEILISGKVARGPGKDCWIINANTGEMFNFYGADLGKMRTVGAEVKVIAKPEMDKVPNCNQGRPVTVLEYRVIKLPNYTTN